MSGRLIQHIVYGMNGESIPKMSNRQLISAFFQAAENLPSIEPKYRQAIMQNMFRIADLMSDRVDAAKSGNLVRLRVHLFAMQAIVKTIHEREA